VPVVAIPAAAHRVMPWRNGLGVTREIAVRPGATRFAWRASIARVERPCPFSSFPGYDRTIMVIDGPGMVLEVDGQTHRLDRRFVPLAFAGEAAVACTPIDGATDDYNVMTDRASLGCRVAIHRPAEEGDIPGRAGTLLVTCLAGTASVAGHLLGPWDSVLADDADRALPVTDAKGAILAVVTIGPR